jgi:hypothetical protein
MRFEDHATLWEKEPEPMDNIWMRDTAAGGQRTRRHAEELAKRTSDER